MFNTISIPGHTVLITGASSGIGAALAREFVARGARVAMVARRLEQLEALAAELTRFGGKATAHKGDVTVDGDIARVVAELASQGIKPDIVVANAGFGVVGNVQQLSIADYQRQFDTNVFGVLRTLQESLAPLRATRGRFVIMGSVAGHLAAAGASPYAMSKFAVRALAEALHGDLLAAGIGVTLLSPGFVESDIRRVDNRGALHAEAEDTVPAWLRMPADKAARAMVKAIARGKREAVITAHGKLMVFIVRHFPRFTRFMLLRARGKSRPEPSVKR